ncbi:hypothetical protein M0R45_006829 [Rubus argutus]|uniref:Uncharacterized protein n=1 Tax=Rubus argutus TaxID=59490 RepID=A0AAW1YRV6_RUBAR
MDGPEISPEVACHRLNTDPDFPPYRQRHRSYPQGIGQAEKTNRTIFDCIKTRLERRSRWYEELPGVLWAYRTTKRTSTEVTPYALTFGSEAIIPTEAELPTTRTLIAESGRNDDQLGKNLGREAAAIKVATKTKDQKLPKFAKAWEGPYEITVVVGRGAYRLKEVKTGKQLPRLWNAIHLRKFYA